MKKRTIIVSCLVVVLIMAVFTYVYALKKTVSAEGVNDNMEVASKDETEETKKEEVVYTEPLVKYEGPVHHVFFHSLIAYTNLAFDGDSRANGYNYWMTTASEFEKMLPELLERGYILYDIEELMEKDPEDPTKIKKKDIYLPEGKKPLVISIDDVNYYEYMKPDGFAEKLVLDADGRVANEIKNENGEYVISRKADVMPILDDFVKEHPEFSFKGAKGVIALTGYQGALGYRITDLEGEELQKAIEEATKVANKLKEDGWRFACHSYTHNQYFKKYTVTMDQLKYDTERWKKYIAPVVGDTNIYISPFGIRFKTNDERYRYLVNEGFNIFCPVQKQPELSLHDGDNLIMTRFNLDGYSMFKRSEYINENYFNVENVIDKSRPELK